jgi:hypothetical protein
MEWTSTGGGAVTAADAILRAIAADYPSQPPRVILSRVTAFQQLADGIEAEYILRPADITRLWRLAGIAAGLRGWLENNAGDTDAARVSLREAHRRGELIDDRQVTAWVRFMQATVEDFTGNIDAAECYALDGLLQTTDGSPQRALILGSAIAGVRAAKGDHGGAEKALAEARGIVSTLPPEQHGNDIGRMIFDAMSTYSPAGFASDAGNAYARLGRPDRLAEVTVGVRRAADRAGTPYRASFRMNEATAVLRSADPDPEGAADLARQGLACGSPFQAAYLANRLDVVLKAAKPFATHRAIRDLVEYSAVWRADHFTHRADDI